MGPARLHRWRVAGGEGDDAAQGAQEWAPCDARLFGHCHPGCAWPPRLPVRLDASRELVLAATINMGELVDQYPCRVAELGRGDGPKRLSGHLRECAMSTHHI